jgi:hypothetical protein
MQRAQLKNGSRQPQASDALNRTLGCTGDIEAFLFPSFATSCSTRTITTL